VTPYIKKLDISISFGKFGVEVYERTQKTLHPSLNCDHRAQSHLPMSMQTPAADVADTSASSTASQRPPYQTQAGKWPSTRLRDVLAGMWQTCDDLVSKDWKGMTEEEQEIVLEADIWWKAYQDVVLEERKWQTERGRDPSSELPSYAEDAEMTRAFAQTRLVPCSKDIDWILACWQDFLLVGERLVGRVTDTVTPERIAKLRTVWSNVCQSPDSFFRERILPLLLEETDVVIKPAEEGYVSADDREED
jgi:hypothetical protein